MKDSSFSQARAFRRETKPRLRMCVLLKEKPAPQKLVSEVLEVPGISSRKSRANGRHGGRWETHSIARAIRRSIRKKRGKKMNDRSIPEEILAWPPSAAGMAGSGMNDSLCAILGHAFAPWARTFSEALANVAAWQRKLSSTAFYEQEG